MTQTSPSALKCIKKWSFWIFTTICHIYTWVDFVCILTCLVFPISLWWPVWVFCAQTPLANFFKWSQLKKLKKGKIKKIFCGPSKIFKTFSWPINICLIYFLAPTRGHFFFDCFKNTAELILQQNEFNHCTISWVIQWFHLTKEAHSKPVKYLRWSYLRK